MATKDSGDREREQTRGTNDDSAELSASEAAELALEHIGVLTAKELEGVVSLEPSDEGWLVGIEVLEERRVPSSADMLALYEAEVDPDGDLMSYRRLRRYSRGQANGRNGGS